MTKYYKLAMIPANMYPHYLPVHTDQPESTNTYARTQMVKFGQ